MQAETLLSGLRAAGEPTRLRLLALCARGELTVSELTGILGYSQPRISQHLKTLCDAGLVDRFPEGKWAFYRLAETGGCGELSRALAALLPEDDADLAQDLDRLVAVKRARQDRAAAYFRANAAQWNEIRSLYVPEAEVEAALLAAFGGAGIGDFLDVGTGTGRILELFAPRVAHGTGIDLSREMLGLARARIERADLRNCQVRQADMYRLPLGAASVDAAVFHLVLHYAEDPAAAIREAARVLRPGGRLVVADFAPHDQEFLREVHAHRRLGFGTGEVEGWARAAGLVPGAAVELAGDPLTVCLWPAAKPGDET